LKKLLNRIRNWEAWPFALIYAPVSIFWLWYIIKSRALWFFTPSNPKLTFGGMEGEPKREMYDLLPPNLYPTTINVLPGTDFEKLIKNIAAAKIPYPLIVKPEVGGQGILFRKIDNEIELKNYNAKMLFEYVVQAMVHYPIEVSVFHIKYPNKPKGEITGFLHKIPLQVLGDGVSTLEQLIIAHPKANKRVEELIVKHGNNFNKVIANNEKYVLSYAANHNRGAHFIDLKSEIDDALLLVFDNLNKQIGDFYYGRYDILCNSIAELKQGKNYSILEYNGCGAEPNHFYDTGYTLNGAHKEILKHWKALYEISKINKKNGVKPWKALRGYKFLRQTRKLYAAMRNLDKTID
jgi:hypothetical protein